MIEKLLRDFNNPTENQRRKMKMEASKVCPVKSKSILQSMSPMSRRRCRGLEIVFLAENVKTDEQTTIPPVDSR